MKDKLGQEIKVGSWIVYGHALGRCSGLRIGKVLSLVEAEPSSSPWNDTDKITVWGLDDDHADYYAHNKDSAWARPRPLTKKSILFFHNRCIVVPKAQVPKQYVQQIEDVTKGEL